MSWWNHDWVGFKKTRHIIEFVPKTSGRMLKQVRSVTPKSHVRRQPGSRPHPIPRNMEDVRQVDNPDQNQIQGIRSLLRD